VGAGAQESWVDADASRRCADAAPWGEVPGLESSLVVVIAQELWADAVASRRCAGASPWCRLAFAMSAAVSLAAQNVGGEFIHPMVRDRGTATS